MEERYFASMMNTLEDLIMPGKRARLSPFVETAQSVVLFDEVPNDQQRATSISAILTKNEKRIMQIAECWKEFAREGKQFAQNNYDEPNFLDAYLAYYFSVNVPKVQLVLLDLVRENRLHGTLNILDIGVGTGTTAIAFLDFFLVWGQICQLYGESFPITDVRLTCLDRSSSAIDWSRSVVNAYSAAVGRFQALYQSSHADEASPENRAPALLSAIQYWADSAEWVRHDL